MKRTLAIILSLVMLFSVLPLMAFAADVDIADTGSILSGTTGTAQFTVEDRSRYPRTDGGYELSVIGTNSTYEQTGSYTHTGEVIGNAPWMAYKDYINLIKIKDVKYLRKDFYSCGMYFSGRASSLDDKGLTVTLDDKLLEINSFCFYNAHITSINFSDAINLEKIDEYSFYGNDFTELETNADTIGHNAFENCNNLKNVTFTNLNTTVGVDAFSGCNNIDYVFWAGTPESFNAALASGNDCLKNADVIEYGNQKSITQPIYLTVVEPVVEKVPDYSITLADNEYCELDTATYDRTGLDIMNLTTNQPANWWPFEGDCTYRYFAYMQGKSGQNYQYVFTKDTPVYINGKKAKIEAYRLLPSVSADAYIDFTLVDNRWTVTFDPNGGTGNMAPVKVNKGSSYKLPECGFTHPNGNQFKNWKIGSYVYNPGDTVTINSNTTVYAQWKGKYTITYDPNGGTGTMAPETYNEGDKYVIPACRFTPPTDMIFGGWLVDGKPDSVGDYWNVYSDHVLKPQWIPSSGVAERVDITVTAPKANEMPSYDAAVYGSGNVITGNEVPVSGSPGVYTQYKGVLWRDMTTRKNHRSNAAFVDGHVYRVSVDLKSLAGTKFNFEDDSKPMTQIYINGSAAEIQPSAVDNNICTAMYTFTAGSGSTVSGSETSYLSDTDTVTIQLLQSDTVKYSTTATGNTASYSITGVANGTYTLRVSKKNHVDRDYSITVSGNKTQDVKICPKGDTNNDGSVKANDATMAYRHAQGKSLIIDPYQLACANVAGNDEYVKANDATQIYRQAQGKHSLF